jgi:hypothetical protein
VPIILLGIINTIIFSHAYASTHRIAPAESISTTTRAIPLTNRNARVLKHMIFMFVVYIAGWAPIFLCIVIQPSWFTSLIFNFMLILPHVSMIVDIGDLFLYNHVLRTYFKEKISIIGKRLGNIIVFRIGHHPNRLQHVNN